MFGGVMQSFRLYFTNLLLIVALFSLSNIVLAQDKKDCPNQKTATVSATLPVAITKDEYKEYQEITSQTCSQTMIDQGLAFIEKAPDSQLCFPLYQNLVTAAIRLNDFEQAFVLGRKALATYPDHVLVMTQLSTIASNQALMGNTKYFVEGEKLTHQVLDFLKSNKTPSGYLEKAWNPYKKTLFGDVYQSLGIFALLNNCSLDAAQALTTATEINSEQPYTYFLLAKAQVRLYKEGHRNSVNSFVNISRFPSLNEQIVTTYAKACLMTEEEKYAPLRKAIDYDIEILSKAFPDVKTYLAKTMESIRSETNAALVKPVAQ